MEDVLQIPIEADKHINAVIRQPDKPTTWTNYGVIITHGAGGDMNSKQIITFVNALHEAGFVTIRFTCKPPNFTYRVRCYKTILDYCKNNLNVLGYVLSGRSMGARVAAQVALDRLSDSAVYGVACLSYPLHKSGNMRDLRSSHLVGLTQPLLMVSGDGDAMCAKGVLENVVGNLNCDVTVHLVEGKDHSLKLKDDGDDGEVGEVTGVVVKWCQSVFCLEKS